MNVRRLAFIAAMALCASLLAACNQSSKPAAETSANPEAKRYPLKGKVVSLDAPTGEANVDAEAIPGFMDAMVMSYKVKDPSQFAKLAVGDSITADVVVQGDQYWLENVKVVASSGNPPPKPAAALHIPETGEAVPNFQLINQSGKRIFLQQYRGKTLLLTFIYTRCPFPDYCPRVSHEFAQVNTQLETTPALYKSTHLLSISFDPVHDTPKVLRAYGFACASTNKPTLFNHWEFAASPASQLPALANFFGLTYKEEGGLITHSLSTAVIGPDGRILKWYHGNDWQASDLMKDVTGSTRARTEGTRRSTTQSS